MTPMKENQIRTMIVAKCQVLGLEDAKFIHELNLGRGKVRADVVALKNGVHGIEIKSKFDNLNRLRHQLAGYSKVFNSVTLVCDPKHNDEVYSLVPEWFGIVTYLDSDLVVIRPAKDNPLMRAEFVLDVLMKDELLSYALKFCEDKNLTNSRVAEIRGELLKTLSLKQVFELYENCLRIRFQDSSQ